MFTVLVERISTGGQSEDSSGHLSLSVSSSSFSVLESESSSSHEPSKISTWPANCEFDSNGNIFSQAKTCGGECNENYFKIETEDFCCCYFID